jgi:hypothetical protein
VYPRFDHSAIRVFRTAHKWIISGVPRVGLEQPRGPKVWQKSSSAGSELGMNCQAAPWHASSSGAYADFPEDTSKSKAFKAWNSESGTQKSRISIVHSAEITYATFLEGVETS